MNKNINKIMILGSSTKIGKFLEKNIEGPITYCRQNNGDLLDFLSKTPASKNYLIINLINDNTSFEQNIFLTNGIINYCNTHNCTLIHISSQIVYSKLHSSLVNIKSKDEVESNYTRNKIEQEKLVIKNSRKFKIIRSGYLCNSKTEINFKLFKLFNVSKKPKNSVLFYCLFEDLKKSIFKNEVYVNAVSGKILMKDLLHSTIFIPKWIYILVSVFKPSLKSKIKELIYEG